MNPTEHVKLKRQVDELFEKNFIKECMSHCAIPALLMPKKDETWHMCVDNCVNNKIMVKNCFPIS